LELKVLKPPKDGYAFARRWPTHFEHALNIETKHSARLRREFDFAIRWLKSNVSANYCAKYSLIHGDAHPANAFLTNGSKITLLDWEAADIGDPAFDVAYAYHLIKVFYNPRDPDSAEQTANRFLSRYLEKSRTDVRPRLKFYQLVAILGYAVPYSSSLSSPIKAYKYNGRKMLSSIPFLRLPLILLAFPFLRWSFVARKVGIEGKLHELRYFSNFIRDLA
jgi:aminoglycoside phosphotransferase (APT) family kinase protein